MSRIKTLIIIAIILLLGILVINNKNCRQLGCIKMDGLDSFEVGEIYQNENNVYRALLIRGGDKLRVEVLNLPKSEVGRETDSRIAKIKALYENAPAPYPGEVSDEITCSKEFKPQFESYKNNDLQIEAGSIFLSERLTYGVCTEDQAFYRGVLAIFYCPNSHKFYQFEFITPKNEYSSDKFESYLKSIGCR